MGGQSGSTLQGNNSQLSQLFAQNQGYQQPNQVAPIAAPLAQTPILPTPEQAAAATRARMLARSPMAAPVAAPKQQSAGIQRGGNGDSHGRGSGGAW